MGPNTFLGLLHNALTLGSTASEPDELLWASDNDFPVHTIALTETEVKGWEAKTVDGRPVRPGSYIGGQLRTLAFEPVFLDDLGEDSLTAARWLGLFALFGEVNLRQQCIFQRPTDQPDEYDFYLLAHIGGEWVGLKTKVVET
ncbi:hypothetical protein [Fibrella aestuarina]|uniref:hypothetical protein n=1 Tax=Fibrella aestuarina TaxID=651143 RepID=UPI0002F2B05C|nr:hypothetical protein [Fibrella aestuarina]